MEPAIDTSSAFREVADGGAYRTPKDPATADWNYGRPGNTGYRSRVRRGIEKPRKGRRAPRKVKA